MKNRMAVVCGLLWMIAGSNSIGQADSWPMKQRDQYHTGRAAFAVPATRMNETFFDVFLWQTPTPGSPGEGNFGGSSMSFFDGAGPDGGDIVTGTYHWPKGVQGMERHTGKLFWCGNPDGGEYIAHVTPGFSVDGSTIYVINDSTSANGPLMAFSPIDGPSIFRDNRYDINPEHLSLGSPLVCWDDGRIFAYSWDDRPYAAWDYGSDLGEVWAAPCQTYTCFNEPSLWTDMYGNKYLISIGRGGFIMAFDDYGNTLWDVPVPAGTDMTPTIDPDSGSIYAAVGMDHIYVVGLDINGYPLWDAAHVHDFTSLSQPQRAVGTGCLSFDGATYYFQTAAENGSGKLYAINTSDGSLKWTYDTQSKGWEEHSACPIVTENNVVIVGNNDNNTYFAIEDQGQDNPVLLDTLSVDESGSARASATLSADGLLYLPIRTIWTAGNGSNQVPDYTTQNLFCALDMTEDAQTILYPPGKQRAIAGNGSVMLKWIQVQDSAGVFDHYAIYRDTAPFASVAGMTPLATVDGIDAWSYRDDTAQNGTSYYYAITAVTVFGEEVKTIQSLGPRIPRDETDLQVVSISRTPFYPRYCVDYTSSLLTEESGFGPYWCSAATGFCDGQDENTKHWPAMDESITYTAKIRNRGTNTIYENILITWEIDGAVVDEYDSMIFLMPGETKTWDYILPWDDQSHDIRFSIDIIDARPENNSLESNTLAVGFLTYIDESFIEQFRDEWSGSWPDIQTDDVIDWLNMHMKRFNQLFAEADCQKRVHYDVLEVLDDLAEDPQDPAPIHFAIFPFRYHWDTDGDPRLSGYYHTDDDIDYGLLHEMGHQLGMIDIYQFDLSGEQNQINGQGYSAHDDLMRGCSPFIAEFHALAMNHWLKVGHGYYGQFLYNLPQTIQLRLLDYKGRPLDGATVKIYQICERDGVGKVITDQVKAQITTDENGMCTLPNVPVDQNLVPPIPTGDALHDNPFGYVHVVGTNGVLLFRVEYNEGIDYCWLDITEACVAYWRGQTDTAVFERQLVLGGPVMRIMPRDLAELTAYDWDAWAEAATASVEDDMTHLKAGAGSMKFVTDGGFDTYLRYPKTYTALWDLSDASQMHIWFYAENSHGFQNESPWIRLKDADGNYFEYAYYEGGGRADFLNQANYQWKEAVIPLDGAFADTGWNRTSHGLPDISRIQYMEIHADTWDCGFNLWVDDVRFDWPEYKYRDFQTDKLIDIADMSILAGQWLESHVEFAPALGADLTQDKCVDLADFAMFAQSWLEGMLL
ncbi:MAG: PQQ-binding-like beta-propeller repeat protein [Sedimentisphaerales bacterium]|nr:PQQ-binding-like beta-propeller repeat protein [Sedimentisphaerales bacterium]